MLDPTLHKPFCSICNDLYYLVDRDGRYRPCPACTCPRCQRLKYAHPDDNGCCCNRPQTSERQTMMSNAEVAMDIRSMIVRLAEVMEDECLHFKAHKKIGGALTRLTTALHYVESYQDDGDAAPINPGGRRFEFLCGVIREAIEQSDCTFISLDYRQHGRKWEVTVWWHMDLPGQTTTYLGYRSASTIVRDWQPAKARE